MIFETTPEQQAMLRSIVNDMVREGVDPLLCFEAAGLAISDQGVFDLMFLWLKSVDQDERKNIVEDIKKSISDYFLNFSKKRVEPAKSFAKTESRLHSLSSEELQEMSGDIVKILSRLSTNPPGAGKVTLADICSLSLHLLHKVSVDNKRRKEYDNTVRTAVRKERHEPITTEKRLYAVTTIDYRGERTPVVCDNFEDACEYVESNSLDLWENSYMLAVIEPHKPNHPYMHGLAKEEMEGFWYRWNLDEGRYEPIEKPKAYEGTICFGIG